MISICHVLATSLRLHTVSCNNVANISLQWGSIWYMTGSWLIQIACIDKSKRRTQSWSRATWDQWILPVNCWPVVSLDVDCGDHYGFGCAQQLGIWSEPVPFHCRSDGTNDCFNTCNKVRQPVLPPVCKMTADGCWRDPFTGSCPGWIRPFWPFCIVIVFLCTTCTTSKRSLTACLGL